jgi:glycosyltransferase involved in cell wall biosynthesis
MSNPFFSIVIPVYNTIKELRRCVDSVMSQTFEDFELILVDDGSTDGSGALCDRLSAEDSRIKTIHKANGGCAAARNTGIRAAEGKYLLFLDSDDMWNDNDALEKFYGIVQSRPVDIVCFGVSIYDEDGNLVKIRKAELSADCGTDKTSVLRELVYKNQYFSACYVRVYDREFLLKNKLFFVDGLLCEDIEWCARVMVHAKEIAVYSGQLYKRIQRREGSQTANLGEKNVLAILHSIEQGVVYVQKYSESSELLALYYEYWAYQYAMMLGFVPVVQGAMNDATLFSRVSALNWLLTFDHVKKVKAVHMVNKCLGIKKTIMLLSVYYHIGRR